MHTKFTCCGEQEAIKACRICVSLSIWFEVTPLPDDKFEITVKTESAHLMTTIWNQGELK